MQSFSLKKYLISALAPSMRSPSGITGWIARRMMKTSNPYSTAFGIERLGLQTTDVFVEIGAGEGAGVKTIMTSEKVAVPDRIVLVEISDDFRKDLKRTVDDLEQYQSTPSYSSPKIEIYGNDCKDMSSFLENDSVDKIFAMNVVYFLDPLLDYSKELYRVLKPNGLGTIIFGCKLGAVPKDGNVFINVEADSIKDSMEKAGFLVTSEFVNVSEDNPMQNYLEIKGVTR